jgi:hypothetical protein
MALLLRSSTWKPMSQRNGHNGENRFEEADDDRPDKPINGHAHHDEAAEDDRHDPGSGLNGSAPAAPRPAPDSVNRRNLSEISRLFLSDVRDLSGEGRAPPQRVPPKRVPPASNSAPPRLPEPAISSSLEHEAGLPAIDDDADLSLPPVTALIGAKLNGTLIRRACQFASGLAGELPVGLVVVEATEIRLVWVAQGQAAEDKATPESFSDPGRLHEALLEMSCDIGRWLVVLPDPRLVAARRLLAGLRNWVLLAPADHEGIVASYRVLKGLCDLELPEDEADAPSVTLALVDAGDAGEAQRHARKLMGVCKQFLDLEIAAADLGSLASGPAAGPVSRVEGYTAREVACAAWPDAKEAEAAWPVLEQVLLSHRRRPAESNGFVQGVASIEMSMSNDSKKDRRDEAQPLIPDHMIPPMARPPKATSADAWVHPDLERLERRLDPRPRQHRQPMLESSREPVSRRRVEDIQIPDLAKPARPSLELRLPDLDAPIGSQTPHGRPQEQERRPLILPRSAASDEVIDLPAGETVADVVLGRLDLVLTPVAPPMLPEARLCVSRDGAVVLVAVASPGLGDLPTIGQAMTWATENRRLLRMALSQYRLNESAEVLLHLLVSRADANAEALRPLLSTGRVTAQAYRSLTWGGRSGLLLEAA